jgi:hypothetical protein
MSISPRRKSNSDKRSVPYSDYSRFCAPLLRLSAHPADNWTIGDSFKHTLVLGGTGSGKASAETAASAFMRAVYGGTVMCAKPDAKAAKKRSR